MFTGIVERSVRVVGVADGPMFRRLTLTHEWTDLRDGESVAVNGCCLTVAEIGEGTVGFDVVQETLSKTNLGLLKGGDLVHVERALRVGDRLDGHFVQGHVDGTAKLIDLRDGGNELRLSLEAPRALAKYIVPKGSVALDGVSLTVADLHDHVFEVALIPTTVNVTTLAKKPVGWPYNLETDVLTKTIISHLERRGV